MRIWELQEAQYHVHPAVDLVRRAEEQNKSLEAKFPLSELRTALISLEREFGEPELDERVWMTGGSSRRWKWKKFQVDEYEDYAYIHTYQSIPF